MTRRRGARSFGIALFFILCVCACKKKPEPVQQVAPTETGVLAEDQAEILAQQSAARAKALEAAGVHAGDGGASSWGREDDNSFSPDKHSLTGGPVADIDGGAASMIRQETTTVNGKLPPEVIQHIVRRNFARFKLCYTNALRSNPALRGRVTIKYVIDRDGSVKGTPQDAGSDLPDRGVIDCVARAFQTLSYPQPEGGIVTVVYPLVFSPSE